MAEQEQPKKGSTSKFSDTMGKMDALAYNALGVNVESLCQALGVDSLSDLKNIKWSDINWMMLLSLLQRLSPSNLKALLARLSLGGLNLGWLLSMLGVPANLIYLLEFLRSQFSTGSGNFNGSSGNSAVSGSTITPNTGWLPGDDESILDGMLSSGQYPETGTTMTTPDDPNDPDYVPPGSENVLGQLQGATSPEDILDSMLPPGGVYTFYYEYVETPVRFDYTKFVPWSDVGGFDFIRSAFYQELMKLPSSMDFVITKEEYRIDLIAYSIYKGTYIPTQYWWILMLYNGIQDISELKRGTRLKVPKLSDLEDLYFRVKSQGASS